MNRRQFTCFFFCFITPSQNSREDFFPILVENRKSSENDILQSSTFTQSVVWQQNIPVNLHLMETVTRSYFEETLINFHRSHAPLKFSYITCVDNALETNPVFYTFRKAFSISGGSEVFNGLVIAFTCTFSIDGFLYLKCFMHIRTINIRPPYSCFVEPTPTIVIHNKNCFFRNRLNWVNSAPENAK